MLIDPELKGRYPKAAKYLEKDLPKVVEVPAIAHAFRRIGNIGDAEFKLLFKSYTFMVVENDESLPAYTDVELAYIHVPEESWLPAELRIDAFWLLLFDMGWDLAKTRSGLKVHIIGAIALAAMVNYKRVRMGGEYSEAEKRRADQYVRDMYGWADRASFET